MFELKLLYLLLINYVYQKYSININIVIINLQLLNKTNIYSYIIYSITHVVHWHIFIWNYKLSSRPRRRRLTQQLLNRFQFKRLYHNVKRSLFTHSECYFASPAVIFPTLHEGSTLNLRRGRGVLRGIGDVTSRRPLHVWQRRSRSLSLRRTPDRVGAVRAQLVQLTVI